MISLIQLKPYRIVGLDPGTNSLGFAYIDIDKDFKIVETFAFTIKANVNVPYNEIIVRTLGEKEARIDSQYRALQLALETYNPDVVISESPFFNSLRPNAFAPLLEVINLTKRALRLHNPNLPLATIDPPTIKKMVGGKGNDKKEVVKANIMALEGLYFKSGYNIADLDEHAIDAIGVAYSWYKQKFGD